MKTVKVEFVAFEEYTYKSRKYLRVVYKDKLGKKYYQTIKESKRIKGELK